MFVWKGSNFVSSNELELIRIVRESADPEKVTQYMLSLFLEYLQTHAPSQGTPFAAPQESV